MLFNVAQMGATQTKTVTKQRFVWNILKMADGHEDPAPWLPLCVLHPPLLLLHYIFHTAP